MRVTFLYIGTSIGAGFSSGKEIALFFGDMSPANVALAGLFMALLCALFMIAGKLSLMPKNYAVRLGIFVSAAISLCSMLAGSEYVLKSLSGVPMLGLLMGITAAVIVVLGIEKIKMVNAVCVPLIILMIMIIFFNLETPVHAPGFSLYTPILYSGMDVLLSGAIISEEGKKLSYKEILVSCAFTGMFLGLILFMLQTVVLSDTMHSSMPVLAISERFGLKAVCGILIACAIFTTMVSALQIVTNTAQERFAKTKKLASLGKPYYRDLTAFGALTLFYPISFLGFDFIVDTCYPFISMCGIILTVLVSINMIIKLIKKRKKLILITRDSFPHGADNSNSRSPKSEECRRRRLKRAANNLNHKRNSHSALSSLESGLK